MSPQLSETGRREGYMYGYIYETTNNINGKKYIGQHKGKFTLDYLGSGKIIKQSVIKHGKANFIVRMIDFAETKEQLDYKEIFWIQHYKEQGHTLYNIHKGGKGGFDEYNANARANNLYPYNKGRKMSKEFCLENSKRQKHYWASLSAEEKYLKYSAPRIGKKHSLESRQKQSATTKGVPKSEIHKQRIRLAHKGKKLSIEQRQAISLRNKGVVRTDAQNEKNRISALARKDRWMNNGIVSVKAKETEQSHLTELGYKYGRILPVSAEVRAANSRRLTERNKQFCKFTQGTIWMYNNVSQKRIKPAELNEYLLKGFVKGRMPKGAQT